MERRLRTISLKRIKGNKLKIKKKQRAINRRIEEITSANY